MIYHFKQIENGQITDGYTVIQINKYEAEITDEAAILLAEKHGGELIPVEAPARKRKSETEEAN